jgi:hypothetical protein
MINPGYTKGQEMIYDFATMELHVLKEILTKKFLHFNEDSQFFIYFEGDSNI